jgi:hypothetical protein
MRQHERNVTIEKHFHGQSPISKTPRRFGSLRIGAGSYYRADRQGRQKTGILEEIGSKPPNRPGVESRAGWGRI